MSNGNGGWKPRPEHIITWALILAGFGVSWGVFITRQQYQEQAIGEIRVDMKEVKLGLRDQWETITKHRQDYMNHVTHPPRRRAGDN